MQIHFKVLKCIGFEYYRIVRMKTQEEIIKKGIAITHGNTSYVY